MTKLVTVRYSNHSTTMALKVLKAATSFLIPPATTDRKKGSLTGNSTVEETSHLGSSGETTANIMIASRRPDIP
ncbi:hypothetical protein TNCV_3018831 [Trichonephila clavipes]|nr:hypothetical protein TNCV_3018831 [Trichonephila clavipes]